MVVLFNLKIIIRIKRARYKPLNLFKDKDFLFNLEARKDGTLVYIYIVDYNMIIVQVKNNTAKFLII